MNFVLENSISFSVFLSTHGIYLSFNKPIIVQIRLSISCFLLKLPPQSTRVDAQMGVPMKSSLSFLQCLFSYLYSHINRKSIMTTLSSSVMRKWLGFRSRWIKPASWIYCTARSILSRIQTSESLPGCCEKSSRYFWIEQSTYSVRQNTTFLNLWLPQNLGIDEFSFESQENQNSSLDKLETIVKKLNIYNYQGSFYIVFRNKKIENLNTVHLISSFIKLFKLCLTSLFVRFLRISQPMLKASMKPLYF